MGGVVTAPLDGGLCLAAGLGTLAGTSQSEKTKRDLKETKQTLEQENITLKENIELLLEENERLEKVIKSKNRTQALFVGIFVSIGMFVSFQIYKRYQQLKRENQKELLGRREGQVIVLD